MPPSSTKFEKVCVVGLGYIGLPTSGLLASRGFSVHGVDTNAMAVESINRGTAHIVEPDLDVLVRAGVNSGRLTASSTPALADVFIIAVPTPFKAEHVPDLTYVEAAVESICPVLRPGALVILESTSPVGTTERVARLIQERRQDLAISGRDGATDDDAVHLAYCPERVLPGAILRELISNDRIVGGITPACSQRAREFYSKFVTGDVVMTNSRTAELVKLSENAYRDVNIAFANELSRVSERLGIDVWELVSLANRHPRVNILRPGPGVGGHCIAVDPWFIVDSARDCTDVIQAARRVNNSQPRHVVGKIRPHIEALRSSRRPIAVLGLSYKPNIDDLRESPAVEVIKLIAEEFDGPIFAVEPHVAELPPELASFKQIRLVSYEKALNEAGFVGILVMHSAFADLATRVRPDVVVVDAVGLFTSRQK